MAHGFIQSSAYALSSYSEHEQDHLGIPLLLGLQTPTLRAEKEALITEGFSLFLIRAPVIEKQAGLQLQRPKALADLQDKNTGARDG